LGLLLLRIKVLAQHGNLQTRLDLGSRVHRVRVEDGVNRRIDFHSIQLLAPRPGSLDLFSHFPSSGNFHERQLSYHVTQRQLSCDHMKQHKSLGSEELRLLSFIADHGPITIRQAADTFGAESGITRSTVQVMMERLRTKGVLTRIPGEGGFVYRSTAPRERLMTGVVKDFVERALGGSLQPFMLYLSERENMSEKELAQLRHLVEKLEKGDA